jgi:hypothetical protein
MDTLTDWITATVAMILVFFCISYAWIIGDDRQQQYLEQHYEELRIEREHMQRRELHPPEIWQRICIDGQNWNPATQECA